jgi:hypothetical protein
LHQRLDVSDGSLLHDNDEPKLRLRIVGFEHLFLVWS